MRPKLELLDRTLMERILREAFQLLENPGVRLAPYVFELLATAGARLENGVAHIPEKLARRALASAPHEFFLYDRGGRPAVHYGADDVHFDPGSSCLNILDSETQQARPAQSADLIRLVQVAEMLPQYAAQSTAVVCNDVPQEIGDWYRLLLVLWYSEKPVVTICETEQSAQAVGRLAHDWFRTDWPSFRSIPPEASSGAVLAHTVRQSAGERVRQLALEAAPSATTEPRRRPDRRSGTDRRTGRVRRCGIERRQAVLPASLERRCGGDRRAVVDRRTSGERRSGRERRAAWAAARARPSVRGDARWSTGEQRRTPSPDKASSG